MIILQGDAGTSADALVVRLVGMTKTRAITKSTGLYPTLSGAATYTDHHASSEDIEFLGYDVQVASFGGGKVAAGVHSFPFSVVLPSGLPPSMKVPVPVVRLGASQDNDNPPPPPAASLSSIVRYI